MVPEGEIVVWKGENEDGMVLLQWDVTHQSNSVGCLCFHMGFGTVVGTASRKEDRR
jgi:hypothetical protein